MSVRKLFRVFVVILMAVNLSGCGLLDNTPFAGLGHAIDLPLNAVLGQKEHPEQALQSLISNLQNQNFDEAATYLSEQTQKSVGKENMQYLPLGSGEILITKVEFLKRKQQAQIHYQYKDSPDHIDQLAYLEKEHGKWKVQSLGINDNY